MAISKPYNLSLFGKVIDAKEDNELSFQVSGDISVALSIVILNNSDSKVSWTLPKTSTYALKYSIPKNVLTNGKEYKISVTVFNEKNESATSDYVVFQTSSRPTVTLSPIGTVNAPNNIFQAAYSQIENISIRSWSCFLYNADQILIGQSGIQTTTPIQYEFNNLKSETYYYIEFQVTSSKGLINTTSKIKFNVLYTQPKINVNLVAENIPDVAGIKISWNVVQIIGTSTCDPVIYITNEKVDLQSGCKVAFSEGFSVNSDFTLKIWLEKPINKTNLLVLDGENSTINLQYHVVDNCFHLNKINKISGITTSYISLPVTSGKYFVCIQQIDGNFNLIALEQ